MKRIWISIKQHRVAAIAYLCYLLFWQLSLDTQSKYHSALDHLNKGERVTWGEGVMYWCLLTYAVSIGSTLVMLLNALLNKEDRHFYLIMAALIIIPLLIYVDKYGLNVL